MTLPLSPSLYVVSPSEHRTFSSRQCVPRLSFSTWSLQPWRSNMSCCRHRMSWAAHLSWTGFASARSLNSQQTGPVWLGGWRPDRDNNRASITSGFHLPFILFNGYWIIFFLPKIHSHCSHTWNKEKSKGCHRFDVCERECCCNCSSQRLSLEIHQSLKAMQKKGQEGSLTVICTLDLWVCIGDHLVKSLFYLPVVSVNCCKNSGLVPERQRCGFVFVVIMSVIQNDQSSVCASEKVLATNTVII